MHAKAAAESESGSGTFRVAVSLARYFSDERARCYMAVARGRRARWLARRLRRTFALPARPALLCRGHLLPPAEPLALLLPDDELEAIPDSGHVVDVSRDVASDEECGSGVARRAPPLASPAPAPAPADADGDGEVERLREVKQRALSLLALHEGQEQEAAPRRRRRVRRRRAPPLCPAPAADPGEPVPRGVEEEHSISETTMEVSQEGQAEVAEVAEVPAAEEAQTEVAELAEVIRNSCGAERAPRCVQALRPEPILTMTTQS